MANKSNGKTPQKDAGKNDGSKKTRLEKAIAPLNEKKRTEPTKEWLQYTFSPEEMKDMSGELARTCTTLKEIEDEKKTVVAQFTAKIKDKQAIMNTLSNKINTGSDHRDIACEITMHDPNTGKKTCRRKDNGEQVWIKDMSASEMQLKLDLDTAEKVKKAMVVTGVDDDNNEKSGTPADETDISEFDKN